MAGSLLKLIGTEKYALPLSGFISWTHILTSSFEKYMCYVVKKYIVTLVAEQNLKRSIF